MTFPLAFAIGFSVASIPGPTIILITTETLRKGSTAGLLTMAAPILLDALVMLPLGLLLQTSIFTGKGAVILGLIGSALLFWLGLQSIQTDTGKFRVSSNGLGGLETPADGNQETPSFLKGIMTHLTSPYPYLYWGTVGSTFIRQGYESGGAWAAAKFPIGFWLGASAFTLLVIYLVSRTKKFLPPHWEPHLHRFSGVLLISSGMFLAVKVWQGLG